MWWQKEWDLLEFRKRLKYLNLTDEKFVMVYYVLKLIIRILFVKNLIFEYLISQELTRFKCNYFHCIIVSCCFTCFLLNLEKFGPFSFNAVVNYSALATFHCILAFFHLKLPHPFVSRCSLQLGVSELLLYSQFL